MIGKVLFFIFSCYFNFHCIVGQSFYQNDHALIWCTTSKEEQSKCDNFSEAVTADRHLFEPNYLEISCRQVSNKDECMALLDQEEADIMSLDGGEVFIGGRYHSLVPILQEVYEGGDQFYYSVAVVKRNTLNDVFNLFHLRGKKACFPRVGSLAGWVVPIETLMREGGLEIIDCNNHVKSAIQYFGPSCAVNSLTDTYNPVGDNSDKLCQICTGPVPGGKCTPSDPYADFHGAFRCLAEVGDIAFLRHTTVMEMTKNTLNFISLSAENFELLCRDGSRRPITEYQTCNWGRVVSDAIVVSSAKPFATRLKYQKLLQNAARIFSPENTTNANSNNNFNGFNMGFNQGLNRNAFAYQTLRSNSTFRLFESAPRYGAKLNLLFHDSAINFHPLDEINQNYENYLGRSIESIFKVRQCPVSKMTLCVTSDPEWEKCIKMKTALRSQLLKPDMDCYKARSHVNCMQAIKNEIADVSVFEAGDVYTAGLRFDEIPFISEVYHLGIPEYYVVAVAKEEDPSTEMTYLKGKYTCHTGIFTGAGWIVPLAYLISNGWIRSYGCDSVHAAAEYFGKSCVPGALNPEYVTGNTYDNLCHLCHGTSAKYCNRDAGEDYYGYTGAFRCLIEGGGDVAFLKHTTVFENTDGKRKEWWARDALNDDFQLLCPDGTRSDLNNYRKCNMGKIQANAIVARGGRQYNETEINAYINLFIYAQQFFGRKDEEEFSMFMSTPPFSDLIFQDVTQQLRVIEPERRYYDKYLGPDFMRARRIVDCHSASSHIQFSLISILISIAVSVIR